MATATKVKGLRKPHTTPTTLVVNWSGAIETYTAECNRTRCLWFGRPKQNIEDARTEGRAHQKEEHNG